MTINTSPEFSGLGQLIVPDLITQDGRIVDFKIGGVRALSDGSMMAFGSADQQLAIVKFNADGTLDTAFGGGDSFSTVRINANNTYNGGGFSNQDSFMNLEQLADGKLIAFGIDNNNEKNIIVKFNADGTLDNTFGGGDGKLGVTGLYNVGFNADGTFFTFKTDLETGFPLSATKYLANGSLDTTYGTNGTATYNIAAHESLFYQGNATGDTFADGKAIGVLKVEGVAYITKNNVDASPDASFGNISVFTENGSATVISKILAISDSELNTNFSGATLTLHRVGGANSLDVFSHNYYILTEGSTLTINGSNVGTILSNTDGALTIKFNAGAFSAYVNGFIQGITYANTSDNPEAQVSIEWSFNDGNTGSQGTGGAQSATTTTTIIINSVNDAPIVANSISDQSGAQGAAFTFTTASNVFNDIEGDNITYSASLSDGSNLPSWLSFDPLTRIFSGTPNANEVGIIEVNLIGTDTHGASAFDTFAINIIDVNDAPVAQFNPANQFAKEGAVFSFTLPTGLFKDQDTIDTQTFTATLSNDSALPTWLTFDPATQTFGGTPTNGDLGIISIKVTVADKESLTATATFDLDVANIVPGTIGADTLSGGNGSNFYTINNAKDIIVEDALNAGTDTAEVSIAKFTLSDNVERMILVSPIAGVLTGNAQDNYILGNIKNDVLYGDTKGGTGNDTLDGSLGKDTLIGGLGNDVYYVDNLKDVVKEAKDAGTDTVFSSVSFNLNAATLVGTTNIIYGVGIENLTLTGLANINATGNALNNTLMGNTGDNILSGGVGNDTMTGGAGNDTYIVNSVGDIVNESFNEGIDLVKSLVSYTLGNNTENLQLLNITKNSLPFGNPLNGTGNELANTITGNLGNNILDGGLGNDTLIGSSGNDTLLGGAGKDLLNGGAGNDSMTGGLGDDTYVINSTKDKVFELAAEGTDTIQSSITFVLDSDFENLTLISTGAINGTGNELTNTITGNIGKNILTGGDGADTFVFSTALSKTNADKITDFDLSEGDGISLSKTIFSALGETITADEFSSSYGQTSALNANQHLIYNEANGNVYYDVDGIGGKASVLFANLHDGLLVTSDLGFSDFSLI